MYSAFMRRPGDISPFVRFVIDNLHVKTNVCSHQHGNGGYRLMPRTVPDYNLIFVTRGQAVWVLNGQKYPLANGDLIVVPPDLMHHGHSLTSRMTLYSIHVEASLPGGRDVFALLNPPPMRSVPPGVRLDRYLRGAASEWQRDDPALCRLMLSHWARLIVPELLLYDARGDTLRPRPIDPVVSDVLETLPRHVGRATSLSELAKESGYTPQHLNRLFCRALGMTPLQYLGRLRMERAASLLTDGRWTVAGVARQVGFEDPYYFSRMFKRHFGRGPSLYRDSAGSHSPSPDSSPPFNAIPSQ
jgi:AraC-like DNA-binding protein